MKPRPFKYVRPDSVQAALEVLAQYGDEARILAGGQSLMPLLSMRLAQPGVLVDINAIQDLDYIQPTDTGITIGALARQRRLEDNPLIAEHVPPLRSAAQWMSHPQIRNRGTIVGSIAHADPSAELPAAALALQADLTIRSAKTTRTIPATDFYLGYYMTVVEPGELVADVSFPTLETATGWSIQEVSRRHGDFALAGVIALLTLDGSRIRSARLAYYGLGSAALRSDAAESTLENQAASDALFEEAAAMGSAALSPDSDIHASADYRRGLAAELTRRALREAAERANAGTAS